MRKGRTCRLRG